MAQIAKMEAQTEVSCSANKFFKLLSSQTYQVASASSDKIHTAEVLKGDWQTSGSIKYWTYNIDGKEEVLKEKTEADEKNMTVCFTAVDGHVLELYESYKAIWQAIPKQSRGALVKITVEYGELKAADTPPTNYLNWLVKIAKDIDAYLAKP